MWRPLGDGIFNTAKDAKIEIEKHISFCQILDLQLIFICRCRKVQTSSGHFDGDGQAVVGTRSWHAVHRRQPQRGWTTQTWSRKSQVNVQARTSRLDRIIGENHSELVSRNEGRNFVCRNPKSSATRWLTVLRLPITSGSRNKVFYSVKNQILLNEIGLHSLQEKNREILSEKNESFVYGCGLGSSKS